MLGSTFLLLAVGKRYFLSQGIVEIENDDEIFKSKENKQLFIAGAFGIAFILMFLEIILYQVLSIFSDYITTNLIISLALLGGGIGGLIGYFNAEKYSLNTVIRSALLLPFTIILAFASIIVIRTGTWVTSVILMLPFVCTSAVISILLVKLRSHIANFAALLGGGFGTLLVNIALIHFREESTILFLISLAFFVASFFIAAYPVKKTRNLLQSLNLIILLVFFIFGNLNLRYDWLNIVRAKLTRKFSQAEVLFSKSSFVGRYDVVKPHLGSTGLSAYENGRITDRIRNLPERHYQIDPRVPHTLIEDPSILIVGLSGDAITKTAKQIGGEVVGIEISPSVISLQQNELVPYNAGSYRGIEVVQMDGRSYIEKTDRTFDMITLMNTHFARGRSKGRQPSPEYLFTTEALNGYLDHLTDRGMIIIEEPITNSPLREVPIWKLLHTVRKVLLDRGSIDPQSHVFVFQWKTSSNNYVQVLIKKTPFNEDDLTGLRQWMYDVDNIKEIEKEAGYRLGPIRCSTTILHIPDEELTTNASLIIKGESDEEFLSAHNMNILTDDLPYLFDIDPSHKALKGGYASVLYLILLFIPVFFGFLLKNGKEISKTLPHHKVRFKLRFVNQLYQD